MKDLTGGVGATVALWSLKQAVAFYRSGIGLAMAQIADQQELQSTSGKPLTFCITISIMM